MKAKASILALLSALALTACLRAMQATSEAKYTEDMLGCVADADTKAQSRACRAEVDRKWEAGSK